MLKPCNCYSRKCKWYLGIMQPVGDETIEYHYCAAFPTGIPKEIAYGEDLHLEETENQIKGFIYEK